MKLNDPLDLSYGGSNYFGMSPEGLIAAGVPAAVVLAAVKDRLKAEVDRRAEALRLGMVTAGAGQALEYQEAQAQAAAALKAPTGATADKYPMLAVTIGIDFDPSTGAPAADVLGVARSVQAARDLWLMAGAAIRGARLKGKAEIDAASAVEAAFAAFGAVVWPDLTSPASAS